MNEEEKEALLGFDEAATQHHRRGLYALIFGMSLMVITSFIVIALVGTDALDLSLIVSFVKHLFGGR